MEIAGALLSGLLHFFGPPLFLRLADAEKSCGNRHRLPTPVRGRTNDIHPPTGSFWLQLVPQWLDCEQVASLTSTAVLHPSARRTDSPMRTAHRP